LEDGVFIAASPDDVVADDRSRLYLFVRPDGDILLKRCKFAHFTPLREDNARFCRDIFLYNIVVADNGVVKFDIFFDFDITPDNRVCDVARRTDGDIIADDDIA